MSLVCSQRATAPPSSIENKAESVQMRTELWSPHLAATAASTGACSLQGKGDIELPFPNVTEGRVNSLATWAAPTCGLTSSHQRFERWWLVKGKKKNKVPRKMRLLHSSPGSENRADCTDSTWWCVQFVSFPPPWDSCTRKTKLNVFLLSLGATVCCSLQRHTVEKKARGGLLQPPFSKALVFLLNLKYSP